MRAVRAFVVGLALAACGTDHAIVVDAAPPPDSLGNDLLPCDVHDVLAADCATCHASPPNSGAPESLTSRYDFFATSSVGGTEGAYAAQRLHDTVMPMPPLSEPPIAAQDVATLDAWLAAGMPAGTCDALPPAPLPTTCLSNSLSPGQTGNAQMYPGLACRTCHETLSPGNAYFFTATVYPAFHERDRCNAPPPSGAKIEILDPSTGAVTATLTPNAVGNFASSSTSAGVAVPFTARLVANGVTRTMVTPQTSGDCDTCHTEQGTIVAPSTEAPPGRLVWP